MAYQSEIDKLKVQWEQKPEQYFAPLADAYRKSGDIEMAIDLVKAGLEKRPTYLSAHIVLGRCLLDQKNDPEARNTFEHVLELDAENIIALRTLSEIAERVGDIEGAHKWVKRLLEVDPTNDAAQETLQRLETAVAAAPPPPPAVVADVAPAPVAQAEEAAPSGFEPTSFATSPTSEVQAVNPAAPDSGVFQLEPQEPAMPDLNRMSAVSSLGVERAESAIDAPSPVEGLEPMDSSAPLISAGAAGGDSGLELDQEMNLKASTSSDFETSTDAMAPPAPTPAPEPELIPFLAPSDEPESQPLPLMDFSEPAAAAPPPVARTSQSFRAPSGIALIMPEEPPPAPVPAPVPVSVTESTADTVELEPVITETMAEVYLRQGLIHEAREVYRKLVELRPADAGLRSRLAALEQRVSAGTTAPAAPVSVPVEAPRPRYAAAETGGQPARSMLAQLLSARPAPAIAAAAAASATPTGGTVATLNVAFAAEPPTGAPTGVAADEFSLSTIFGEEPATVSPPPPPPPAAPAPGPPPGTSGFSFDEFFGGKKPDAPPVASAPAPAAAEAEATPSDFLTWLKGLKS